jgi:hypothetical protein
LERKSHENEEVRPPWKEASKEHSLDDLARGLASGTISRRKALWLLGAGLLSSTPLMMLFSENAEARRHGKKKKRKRKKQQQQAAQLAAQTQAARDAFLAGLAASGGPPPDGSPPAGVSPTPATSIGLQCDQAQILALQCALSNGVFIRVR